MDLVSVGQCLLLEPLRMSPEEKSEDVELSLGLLYRYINNKIQ